MRVDKLAVTAAEALQTAMGIATDADANAVETAYAGYLKAKGLLDANAEGVSGATNTEWNEDNNVTEEEK